MKNNNKEPLFIRERKANYWRGFRACATLSLVFLILYIVLINTALKPSNTVTFNDDTQYKKFIEEPISEPTPYIPPKKNENIPKKIPVVNTQPQQTTTIQSQQSHLNSYVTPQTQVVSNNINNVILNNDRALYMQKCIAMYNFLGLSYANFSDGLWANCVANGTNQIIRQINSNVIIGARYSEAKKLLEM